MQYKNSEIKIDQLISYINDEKINLSPAFQRGHVWKKKQRQQLVKNIVAGKPIPAIFLYKEADGTKYTYNILDGKQRLESLILFIAHSHPTVRIRNWKAYFHSQPLKAIAGFPVELDGESHSFSELSDEVVRDFQEYSIPTIEISLTDDTHLDEVVSLFVDINQQGEAVKRFDIVKAMYKGSPLMESVLGLIAVEQRRRQDIFYKTKKSVFTRVLRLLQVVQNAPAPNQQVDRMWERLLELALFAQSHQHRSALMILKEFIAPKGTASANKRLSLSAETQLRKAFKFIDRALPKLKATRLVTDQTHSYTLITSLIDSDLLDEFTEKQLLGKLQKFGAFLASPDLKLTGSLRRVGDEYRSESTKQTTHVSRRKRRGELFLQIVRAL